MRAVLRALLLLQALVPAHALAADEKLSIELNSIETADNRCRVNFVVENKSNVALESMKLDLVTFSVDGALLRRLLVEMVRCGRPRRWCGHSFSTMNVVKSARSW
jgi:hypothetical protein